MVPNLRWLVSRAWGVVPHIQQYQEPYCYMLQKNVLKKNIGIPKKCRKK